jgi:translation initiation factor IF-3
LRVWIFREEPGIVRQVRTNEQIRAREVLVIGEEGERLGVLPIEQALEQARGRGRDLVEVAPNAEPPVCRILDYGKYKYEQARREREARKHQRHVVLREVRFRPKIDSHDMDFKTRTAEKLLREGDKVKVSIMFRGREITHPELGRALMDRVYERLRDVAAIEKPPTMEGRFMNMILTPLAGKLVAGKQSEQPEKTPTASEG